MADDTGMYAPLANPRDDFGDSNHEITGSAGQILDDYYAARKRMQMANSGQSSGGNASQPGTKVATIQVTAYDANNTTLTGTKTTHPNGVEVTIFNPPEDTKKLNSQNQVGQNSHPQPAAATAPEQTSPAATTAEQPASQPPNAVPDGWEEKQLLPTSGPLLALRSAIRGIIANQPGDSWAAIACEPIGDVPLLHVTARLNSLAQGKSPDERLHSFVITIEDIGDGKTNVIFEGPRIFHADVAKKGASAFETAAKTSKGGDPTQMLLNLKFERFGPVELTAIKNAVKAIGAVFQNHSELIAQISDETVERQNANVIGLLHTRSGLSALPGIAAPTAPHVC